MDKIIYSITNIINGKIYIGQTTTGRFHKRKTRHLYDAKQGNDHLIYRAIRKYGQEQFMFKIIYTCGEEEDINQKEMEYIRFLNTKTPNGYNMTDGGEGMRGFKFTDEHKAKIGMSNKGKIRKPISEETRNKLSNAKIGNKNSVGHIVTDEMRDNLRKIMTGRKLTEETKRKMRKSHPSIKGLPWSQKRREAQTKRSENNERV